MISESKTPERVIIFLVDGLHWQAPQRLNMPVFNGLKTGGTFIEKSVMILPHHPTIGDYGRRHTTSFPNPVLQEGSIFVNEGNKMLQEKFGKGTTAFVANTTAYTSVNRGFNINIHNDQMSDTDVVNQSIDLLDRYDIRYFRIHLQTSGNEGRYLSYTAPDYPYYRNIWGKDSPYIKSVEQADALLGELVAYLKNTGKWETSLLVVSSDHGQSDQGWHPISDEDSWTTPLLFTGPGVAKGRVLDYFEHTDISPTIAGLMGVEKPNNGGGAGIFVEQVLAKQGKLNRTLPEYIRIINTQINQYNKLRAQFMLLADEQVYFSSLISYLENELLTPEPFYHQDRFTEWFKAGSTAHLIKSNQKILDEMNQELLKINKS